MTFRDRMNYMKEIHWCLQSFFKIKNSITQFDHLHKQSTTSLVPVSRKTTFPWTRHDFFPSPSVFKGLLGAILACWCKRHKKVGTQPTYVDGHLLTFPHQATPPLLSMGPAQLEQNQFTQNKSNGLRGTVASGRISRWIRWPSGPPVFFTALDLPP